MTIEREGKIYFGKYNNLKYQQSDKIGKQNMNKAYTNALNQIT